MQLRDKARERCKDTIFEALHEDDPVLVDALPAMGKSRGVVEWAAETHGPLTIFTARHELYDQYEEWCDEFDLKEPKRLPSFHNDCPTVEENGPYDNEWRDNVLAHYNRGLSAGEVHDHAQDLFDERLPCQQGEECSYMKKRDFDPDDFHVLIGHYTHAYVPERTEDRFVVFDEFPDDDFLDTFRSGDFASAVTAYLNRDENLPFDNWRELERKRGHEDYRDDVEEWRDTYEDLQRDTEGLFNEANLSSHALAPLFVQAALTEKYLDNDWGYSDLGESRVAVRNPNNDEWTILRPPSIDGATSVIALDGTPIVEKWRLMLGEDLQHWQVLDDEERREYLRNGLGLRLIQTTRYPKPYNSGEFVTAESDLALFEGIKKRHGRSPALISSRNALEAYNEEGLSRIIPEDRTEYYGNLKGSNKFKTVRLGIIAGSPQDNDLEIQKWGALRNESVVAARDEDGSKLRGNDLDFGSLGNRFLQGGRENEVLQAAMRFGRSEEDGEKGATVFIHTSAIPKWVSPMKDLADIHPWRGHRDGMKKVIEAVGNQDREFRTGDIENSIESQYGDNERISLQTIRTHLRTLNDYGYLKKQQLSERGNPYLWTKKSTNEIGRFGHVDFLFDKIRAGIETGRGIAERCSY